MTSTARQPSAQQLLRRPPASPRHRAIALPHRISASGRFGVSTVARAINSCFSASTACGIDQPGAAFGRHHRIDDERDRRRPLAQHRGQRLDHRGIMQHAGLDRIGADVVEHDLDLLADEIGRDRQDAKDALGILRGQRGDRRRRVGVEHRHRLDVGLNAGAAA